MTGLTALVASCVRGVRGTRATTVGLPTRLVPTAVERRHLVLLPVTDIGSTLLRRRHVHFGFFASVKLCNLADQLLAHVYVVDALDFNQAALGAGYVVVVVNGDLNA